MTVRYLWRVLEEACCGSAVGIQDLLSMSRKVLAVDISIWICEALTSTALNTFHSNPAIYLVFQRTVTLLKLGIKVVAVLEGQGNRTLKCNGASITRNSCESAKIQMENLRTGKNFWDACASCADILCMLGVPVLYAESKGEGLCGLLNERGLVDGVISNDGDCLLYGATNVYTNLSIDSLNQGTAIKYNSAALFATISDEKISLSRKDLITFAILTGSDEIGSGVPYVGAQKAIRFIYLLKKIYAQIASDATLNEIQRWFNLTNEEKVVGESSTINKSDDGNTHISFPDSCDVSIADRKFIQSIYDKAISQKQGFHPEAAIQEYLCPNHGILPDSATLLHKSPNFDQLTTSTILIKGKTFQMSRDYLQSVLLKLAARLIILKRTDDDCQRNRYYKTFPSNKELVEPRHIVKKCQHKGYCCYEILWNHGDIEFTTLEWQHLINKAFPTLVEIFNEKERLGKQLELKNYRLKIFLGNHYDQMYKPKFERKRQMKSGILLRPPRNSKRRRDFHEKVNPCHEVNVLNPFIDTVHASDDAALLVSKAALSKLNNSRGRETFPLNNMFITPTFVRKVPADKWNENVEMHNADPLSDDYEEVELVTPTARPHICDYRYEEDTIDNDCKYIEETALSPMPPQLDDDASIFCEMGCFQIRITPIERTYRLQKSIIMT